MIVGGTLFFLALGLHRAGKTGEICLAILLTLQIVHFRTGAFARLKRTSDGIHRYSSGIANSPD
jgi:hypothetical protein